MKRPAIAPKQLSEPLHKRLNAYALAASASGVGVLALAQSAEAKIVYTPAHVVIGSADREIHYLDVNHDGIADFKFIASHWSTSTRTSFAYVLFNRVGYSNEVRGYGHWYDSALRQGAMVGLNGLSFRNNNGGMGLVVSDRQGHPVFDGAWANSGKGVKSRYLGFRFMISGMPHFGWARIKSFKFSKAPVNFTLILTGYAYETIPNKPIIAGKTHGKDERTLGRLAQGASGVAVRRQEQ